MLKMASIQNNRLSTQYFYICLWSALLVLYIFKQQTDASSSTESSSFSFYMTRNINRGYLDVVSASLRTGTVLECARECGQMPGCSLMAVTQQGHMDFECNVSSSCSWTRDENAAAMVYQMLPTAPVPSISVEVPFAVGSWCIVSTQQLLVADYNGDGYSDLLCHQKTTGLQFQQGTTWIKYAFPDSWFDWSAFLSVCADDTDLYTGDFNGDGKSDLLCHYGSGVSAGNYDVAHASSTGLFGSISWSGTSQWCNVDAMEIVIGDFDGDNSDDIFCHNPTTGTMQSIDWDENDATLNRVFCSGSGSKLYAADVNGDNRDDLICHNRLTGNVMVSIASDTGTFLDAHIDEAMIWCVNYEILIGDFNGDSRDDMACIETDCASIAFSAEDGPALFQIPVQISYDWCIGPFHGVGDFDGNGVTDFICKSGEDETSTIAIAFVN